MQATFAEEAMLTHSYMRICFDGLRHDVQQCELLQSLHDDMSFAADQYQVVLGSLMDKHAPHRSRTVTVWLW